MKIAISAGDPSGDEHGAALIKALKALHPDAQFFGMGGSKLRAAGMNTIIDSEKDASVMGFTEVLTALPRLYGAFKKLASVIEKERPDILVLIDYQEFNIMLAKKAKKLGIRTFFFIAPTIWAWRPGRVKHFKEAVDHLAVIFPFETEVFKKAGYEKVSYVGHPFADNIDQYMLSQEERARHLSSLNIPENASVLALFPGSRRQEIDRHLKVLIEAVETAKENLPNLHVVLPVPPSLKLKEIATRLQEYPYIHCTNIPSTTVLSIADAGIIKSGTSNLQAALAGLPFTMIYHANFFTEWVVRLTMEIRAFSIVNVIRPQTIREIIQWDFKVPIIAEEICKLIQDDKYRQSLRERLQKVAHTLETPESDEEGLVKVHDRLAKLISQQLSFP